MNIVLIGFRCAGKTTVGKILADKLSMPFIDCDAYIERREEMSIKDIFDQSGESHFRLIESDALANIAKMDGKVIATGGGVVLRYKNIRNLKRNGLIIFLEVDSKTATERIKLDPTTKKRRPKFTQLDLDTEIREQMELRKDYYRQAADIIVRTTDRETGAIAEEILMELRNRGIAPSEP